MSGVATAFKHLSPETEVIGVEEGGGMRAGHEVWHLGNRSEKIFLFNGGLDVGYMAAGAGLWVHGANIGVKADWGATVNGELESFDYEFSWSRGTGCGWPTSR